jgi:hypothetical protein
MGKYLALGLARALGLAATAHDDHELAKKLTNPGGSERYASAQAEPGQLQRRRYRQELSTPYINRDDGHMTPNTFEAYTLVGSWSPAQTTGSSSRAAAGSPRSKTATRRTSSRCRRRPGWRCLLSELPHRGCPLIDRQEGEQHQRDCERSPLPRTARQRE